MKCNADFLNTLLEQHGQQARIKTIKYNNIEFTNGIVIDGYDKCRLIKSRILSKSTIWLDNFDRLIAGDIHPDQIVSQIRAKCGLKCWEKHKEKIIKNLDSAGRVPWNRGTKGDNRLLWTPERKQKQSLERTGSGNPFYGKKHTDVYKKTKSEELKTKILYGRFTPNSNNRNTHWDTSFNGKKYRSSWEALFQYFNPESEYETLRIQYTYNNESFIYIVDFINHNTREVYEIKPLELCNTPLFEVKQQAIKNWCVNNSYNYVLVDQNWFKQNTSYMDIEENVFDIKTIKKINKIYEISKKNGNR